MTNEHLDNFSNYIEQDILKELPLIIQKMISPPLCSGLIYTEFNKNKESFAIYQHYHKPISQTLILNERSKFELL